MSPPSRSLSAQLTDALPFYTQTAISILIYEYGLPFCIPILY
jgi:hypothetical protein